jgi:hypothetical protein
MHWRQSRRIRNMMMAQRKRYSLVKGFYHPPRFDTLGQLHYQMRDTLFRRAPPEINDKLVRASAIPSFFEIKESA